MIRPFDWRDLTLLHRIRNFGVCLDSQSAYTRGSNALQNVLLGPLSIGKSTCTLVSRPTHPEEQPAVGQFVHHFDQHHAHMTFLGPITSLAQPSGERLIDAMSQAAGKQGIHHLIAEVDEGSPVFESLHQAGFAIYARQRIWSLEGMPSGDFHPLDAAWRLEVGSDSPAIQSLYLNLVPALVQQVEPPPAGNSRNLVHWDQAELLGYLDLRHGPRGIWVRPYFHPAAEQADDLLVGFMAQFVAERKKPLYVCVRSYQAGLSDSLIRLGFSPCSDQAVMVKRLTATVRRPVLAKLPSLEGTQPEPTAPFAGVENHNQVSRGT